MYTGRLPNKKTPCFEPTIKFPCPTVVCVCVRPQLSSTSSWLGVGNILCAAKSTQELIVLIIAVRSSPGIIGRLPFLGFATQDWYRLARETDRHGRHSLA